MRPLSWMWLTRQFRAAISLDSQEKQLRKCYGLVFFSILEPMVIGLPLTSLAVTRSLENKMICDKSSDIKLNRLCIPVAYTLNKSLIRLYFD